MKTLGDQIAVLLIERTKEELAIGFLRYEALRKLNPREFKELHKRNVAGEHFDEMVTKLIEKL